MKNFFSSKSKCALLCSIFLTVFTATNLHSAQTTIDRAKEWVESCPWIGLVTDEVTYGPITLKSLDLDHCGRLVFAQPCEEIDATVRYKVNADALDSLKLHHILVGIKGYDNPTCISHSFGVWDKKGKASFTIKAPAEKGVYEVRFDYEKEVLCSEAAKAWFHDSPSSKATVGIIIVE